MSKSQLFFLYTPSHRNTHLPRLLHLRILSIVPHLLLTQTILQRCFHVSLDSQLKI